MRKILIVLMLVITLYSCDTEIKTTSGLQDFDVTVFNPSVNVGHEVVFSFSGNPDIIYFYSDEMYHQFDYRNGRIVGIESVDFSFDTAFPTKSNSQSNQLSVMVSTNYVDTGMEYEDIAAADWIDITDYFTYSTSGSYIAAGSLNLYEVIPKDVTYHIGYRYVNDKSEGLPRRVRIRNPLLMGKTEDGSDIQFGQGPSIFRIVRQYPDLPTNSSLSSSYIQLEGVDNGDINPTEEWAISIPFYSGDLDLGLDRPIPIKGLSAEVEDFVYVFDEVGEYNLKFFAKNVTIDVQEEVMRELTITVTDPNTDEEE